ncbi:site-specific integrase [Streptomyces sp. NBC_00829]|uniref:tyrosine-type recombinase/integrase n=1 Tax=Streptomyces sp. NBC_00829 TaxID=2903679 RepID=UPI002F90D050|nr:site-specific integrase [Streptomyces sp. NBC_00829]
MTLALIRDDTPALPGGVDLAAWTRWLQDAVVPEWRPGEWDPQALLFTGDPNNPRTRANSCRTVACSTVVHTRSFCSVCVKALSVSGLDAEVFASEYLPQRMAATSGQSPARCEARQEDRHCGYPVSARGVCKDHYKLWQDWKRKGGPGGDDPGQWLASAEIQVEVEEVSMCVVPGCPTAQDSGLPLCAYHRRRRSADARTGEAGQDAASWAEGQVPFLLQHQFSLRQLAPVLQLELLYAVQQRDQRGAKLDTQCVRHLTRVFAGYGSLLEVDRPTALAMVERASNNTRAHVKEFLRHVQAGYEQASGNGPRDSEVWDAVTAKVASRYSRSGRRYNQGTIDFGRISQPWLREAALAWARTTDPDSYALNRMMNSCVRASQALDARPGGGQDEARLAFTDVDAVVEGFRDARKPDGERYSNSVRRDLLAKFFQMLDFGRRAGLLDRMAGGFARQQSHSIPSDEDNEDEIGKAIPESVIAQLDTHLDRLGDGFPYGSMAPQDVHLMFRTAYTVLRDTGRRPIEVTSLKSACLEVDGGEFTLVWDNHKKKRYRRRLPITKTTATVIQVWQQRRRQIGGPAHSRSYLFPAISEDTGVHHLLAGNLARAIRAWADALPVLDSEVPGLDGFPLPFDSTLVFPYAFRHSYAQRHADAGVQPDVLRDLMDHRSIDTTMGYYKISLERKRSAVNTLRLQVVDRSGRPAPMASATAYEARSVAVPYGNCTEPTNVKAGGKSCALRFQCAGCGFYRPDPSYLPAIEEHLHALRADRETADAMDAAPFVLRNFTDQIDAFKDVSDTMHRRLAELPTDQRAEIEDASRILRKARAAEGRALLPLTVIHRGGGAE